MPPPGAGSAMFVTQELTETGTGGGMALLSLESGADLAFIADAGGLAWYHKEEWNDHRNGGEVRKHGDGNCPLPQARRPAGEGGRRAARDPRVAARAADG